MRMPRCNSSATVEIIEDGGSCSSRSPSVCIMREPSRPPPPSIYIVSESSRPPIAERSHRERVNEVSVINRVHGEGGGAVSQLLCHQRQAHVLTRHRVRSD
ncbi:hypothetical protein MRX96_054119 [Rhipicephalus microplus]